MDRKSLAYDYLKNAIIQNELPPGSPVREMELAGTLKMSRTPIREALKELEGEGVIVSYPARGSFVASLTSADVEEIYELRVLHELWALEKGFSRITDQELDELEAAFHRVYADKDWKNYHPVDVRLHQLIILKSGSKRLVSFVKSLDTQIERIRRFGPLDANRIEASYHEHLGIIALIRRRNLPACKEALRVHLRSVANSAIETAKIIDTMQEFKPLA